VVRDEDELAGLELGVDASRRVRHDERADAERAEHAHAEHDAIRADPLVEMRPPAHDHDGNTVERPEDERARMPDRGRDRPAGDVGVRDLHAILELVRETTEPAAEDDTDERLEP